MKKGTFIYTATVSYCFRESKNSNDLVRYTVGNRIGTLMRSNNTLTAISIDGLKKAMTFESQNNMFSFENSITINCKKLYEDGIFYFDIQETEKHQELLQSYWHELLVKNFG